MSPGCATARPPIRCDGLVDGVGVAAVDDDTGALRGKQFRNGESDAAGAADDDRAAAGQRSPFSSASSWPNSMASMFQ